MSAQLQHFQKAAQLFEEVRRIINLYIVLYLSLACTKIGKGCLDNGLLKYSAKDYFFKALVCWFCHHKNDVQPVLVRTLLSEYMCVCVCVCVCV